MANHEVRKIFIDQGSLEDVIFIHSLDSLRVSKRDIDPYLGDDPVSFNETKTTHLWVYSLIGNLWKEAIGQNR